MGFYDRYVYEYVPIPFSRQYRNSLKIKDETEMTPLSINNYVIPTAFLMGGIILAFVVFVCEKVMKGPKDYIGF